MKKHLLKSLLVGVMTLAATGAWADEITATLVHTSSSGVPSSTAGAYVSTIDAEQEYINNSAFGNKNWQGAAYADFSFEIPAGQTITKATLTWSGIGSGKNRTTDLMYVNAGLSLDYSEEGLGSGTAEVNLAATKIETVTFPANTTTQFTSDVTDAVKTIAASQAYIIFKFTNNVGAGNLVGKGAASGAPVLVITTLDASSTTSYTVKFVDEGGNELKAAAEHTGVTKGTTVSATAEETASFYSEDNSKKYIYASGNSETVVADDGSTVITLVFREAAVYNYSVKTSLGATISEGTAFEGDDITYYFPQYQVADGTLYETAKNSNMLRNTTTADTDNKEIVVNYTATETTGVVFLTEAEDIVGALSTMGGNADIRCSMGTGAYFESDATVTTLAPGKYKLTAQVWGNATTTFAIKVGDDTVLSIDTKGYIYQETSNEFEVTESSDVTIPAVGNANRVLDLLYIVKTGDVSVDPYIAAAKAQLQEAITQATALNEQLNDEDLATAIAAATTALNAEDATVQTLATAGQALQAAVLTAAKNVLLTAIQQATAANTQLNNADLTAAIAAAQAVYDNEEADAQTLLAAAQTLKAAAEAAALDYAKAQLQAAIDQVEAQGIDDETVTAAIAAAKEALAAEDATVESLQAAGIALEAAVKPYVKGLLSQAIALAEMLGSDDLADSIENAKALAANEDATVIELATGLKALAEATMPVALQLVNTAEAYMATFDGEAATALANDFTQLKTDINAQNFSAIKTDIETLMAKATPYIQSAIDKLKNYAVYLNDATLNADITAIETAFQNSNFADMFKAMVQFEKDFTAAATLYLETVKAIDTTGKVGVEDLNAAIEALEAAINAENPKLMDVALKTRNLVLAVKAFEEANFEPVDCTAKVDVNGWKSDMGSVGNYTKDVAQKEQYLTNTTTLGQVLYQTVEGLDNGTYTVELYANASYTSGRGFASAALNNEIGRAIVYAGDVEKTIPVVYQTAVGENNIVTLENVVVSDGTLKMGLRKDIEGSNWHTIQIKALTQVSPNAKADATAQDAYWKGIAETVAAYEAYANVAGVEKAAIAAAETKAAAQAAIPPFYAAKAGYDALAEIIAKAKTVDYDVTEAEALMAAAETTAADAAAKAEELVHPVNLAVNTKAVEGASEENPIETNFVVNGTFDTAGVIAPWKTTGGFQNQTTATNQQGAFTVPFFENWNGSAKVNKMYQEIEDIPNGNYTLKIAAFVNTLANPNESQYVFANGDKTYLTAGEPTAYEVKTIVTNNKIEIGLEQTTATANWMGIDNVSLVYRGETNLDELVAAYDAALAAAQAVEGAMNAEVKAALDAAIAAEVDMTNADALGEATTALTEATAAATACVTAYAAAAEVLPKMKELTESTNVYTEEAYEEYYGQWYQKYEAATLTTEEANALQNPFVVTGWHAAITCDNFLLSAWDTNPDFNNAAYYINTWSTEGENDGSEFKVPFFEYWTGDGNSLGEKTLTATMTGIEEKGVYDVTAWVRVRIKNGAEAPATGITLQANDGDAVDVCAGEQVGTSQFYLKEFTAQGEVKEDGVLNIKFIVAADNNISWLSFQNVKYAYNDVATGISELNTNGQQSVEGVYSLSGQKVQSLNKKGLYIINGRKQVVK